MNFRERRLHTTVRSQIEGKRRLTFGDPGKPSTLQSGQPFNRPTHVALDPKTGDTYISNGYGNSRVHKDAPPGPAPLPLAPEV